MFDQKEANARLENAIVQALEANGLRRGVLGDVLVLAAQHDFDGQSESTSIVYMATNNAPYYRLLGLLDYAQLQFKATIARSADGV